MDNIKQIYCYKNKLLRLTTKLCLPALHTTAIQSLSNNDCNVRFLVLR